MPEPTTVLLWGLGAGALSATLTALCMPLARRLGAVARPRDDRWHRTEIPLLGGLAIALATGISLVAAAPSGSKVLALLAGAGFIAIVGLIDDLRAIKPHVKLLCQLLAATLVVAMGMRLSLTGSVHLDVLLTLLWIVGLTNAFNLLDNMDGLAAGIAVIAASFRLTFFWLDGNLEGATTAAILVGAGLGFLIFNHNPARIFMGDAGSMFLGFFVAGLSLIGGYPFSRGVASILLFPLLLLLVPIFDTTFVILSRILAGRPVSVGGRDHTSHRLVALGLSERRAVYLLYLLAIASGAIAALSYQFGVSHSAVLIIFLILSVGMLALYLSRVQVYAEPAAAAARIRVLRRVGDLSSVRQIGTVLLDFLLIIAAYDAAYLLRFEGDLEGVQDLFLRSLPIVIFCQLLALTASRTYEGIWRYTSVFDLLHLAKSATAGTLLAVAAVAFAFRFEGFSRATFVLDWILLTIFLCGSRIAFRLLGEVLRPPPVEPRRILIYGAGDGGELTLREVQQNASLRRIPVGFLDDDPFKRRRRIRGVPVLGGVDGIERILSAESIQEVIVSTLKIPEEKVQRLAAACGAHGVPVVRAAMRLAAPERVA